MSISKFIPLMLCLISQFHAENYPIQFSIPGDKIVKKTPQKDLDFATIIPGDLKTYIYDNETDYYKGYQRAYYAVTTKKGGWDCLRHYEILANGCIPYFLNLEECHPDTMAFLPKDLIIEAMHLEGVSYLNIDHSKFNKKRYFELLEQILEHTRQRLSTQSIAQYLLDTVGYQGKGKILFLNARIEEDYLPNLTLIGLKQLLGDRIIDFPKIPFLYKTYQGDIKKLYGKGISYTKNIDDVFIDRSNIAERILKREFDLVIYGSVHRGVPFFCEVQKAYSDNEIIFLCGEDEHSCFNYPFKHLFLREFHCLKTK
jgi:hypothetical protein